MCTNTNHLTECRLAPAGSAPWLLALAAMLASVVPASAGNTPVAETPPKYEAVVLANGTVLMGRVLGIDGDKIRIEVPIGDGHAEVRHRMSDFTPSTSYAILAATTLDDSTESHLQLAAFAAAHGLDSTARRQLATVQAMLGRVPHATDGLAAQADAILCQLDEHRRTAVAPTMRAAAGTPHAESARQRRAAQDAARDRAREDGLLATAHRHILAGAAANHAGLVESRHFALARARFSRAATEFTVAEHEAERLTQNVDTRARAAALIEQARTGRSSALLNAASSSLVRTNLYEALAEVNKVLADDPTNAEARAMRARIEMAATEPYLPAYIAPAEYGRRY